MLFYVLFVLCCSIYCLCVNVYYCYRVSTELQLNISYNIISHIISNHIKINLHISACFATAISLYYRNIGKMKQLSKLHK